MLRNAPFHNQLVESSPRRLPRLFLTFLFGETRSNCSCLEWWLFITIIAGRKAFLSPRPKHETWSVKLADLFKPQYYALDIILLFQQIGNYFIHPLSCKTRKSISLIQNNRRAPFIFSYTVVIIKVLGRVHLGKHVSIY